MNKLFDNKNRELKIGDKVRVQKDIPSVDGMLYKNSIVKISEHNQKNNTIRVIESLGKIWWVEPSTVSASYL